MISLERSRLHPADVWRAGSVGLRTRRLRSLLSILGISIGIASMVAVLGLSESSKADLLADLDRLGTNLLTVQAGQTFGGDASLLPEEAEAMTGRIAPVTDVSAVGNVDATVRRTTYIPEANTGGITVRAARTDLLSVLGGSMKSGRWLNSATSQYPVVVLGSIAAARLGVQDQVGERIYIGGHWFVVAGIMDPVELAPDLDRAALIGWPIADEMFNLDDIPSQIYVRSEPEQVEAVQSVIAASANPQDPSEVDVSRPSDALEARAAAKSAFTSLFLGLGTVALLVGGVGIANVMVISVLERRSEVGLRRALGATRRHISLQFLAEALLLSGLGGVGGVALGVLVTGGYSSIRGWGIVLSPWTLAGGAAAALVIGALAGLYPAARAARMSPTEALRTV